MASEGGSRHEQAGEMVRRALPESARVTKQQGAPELSAGRSECEEQVAGPARVWTLRLYVAGDSPKSQAALSNLKRICAAHLPGQYAIEIVDLKTQPELAKLHEILAVPTLIRQMPEPVKRVIGDLSNAERALVGLELS